MLSFDASGNLLNDGVHSYTYDAENRIMQVDGGATATYAYDGNGTRIMKTANGTTTVYAYGGGQLVDEYDNGAGVNSPTREYIYGLGQRVAEIDGGTTIYYHDDHLSPRLLTDASGNVLTNQGHYPFGEAWYQNGQGTQWMFTTYPRDNETGNDYASARYLVNRFGRFMSADPSDRAAENTRNPQSLNLYSYVLNNPINFADPLGLDCVYLNDSGTGIDLNGIDQNSNPGECKDNGGAWAPGSISEIEYDPNGDDVELTYAYGYDANGNVLYSNTNATPGEMNPVDLGNALLDAVAQGTQLSQPLVDPAFDLTMGFLGAFGPGILESSLAPVGGLTARGAPEAGELASQAVDAN